jgi:hypothetical protein
MSTEETLPKWYTVTAYFSWVQHLNKYSTYICSSICAQTNAVYMGIQQHNLFSYLADGALRQF